MFDDRLYFFCHHISFIFHGSPSQIAGETGDFYIFVDMAFLIIESFEGPLSGIADIVIKKEYDVLAIKTSALGLFEFL